MKPCPYCAEEIQDSAIKCRYCGEWLESNAGMSQNSGVPNSKTAANGDGDLDNLTHSPAGSAPVVTSTQSLKSEPTAKAELINPDITKTWKANAGNLWGGFIVQKRKAVNLVKPMLMMSIDGKLKASVRYDPPGNLWRALLATLMTAIVGTVIAQGNGSIVLPGFPLWYLLIVYARRQTANVNLQGAETVVVDANHRRLAFLTDYFGDKRWVAFEVGHNFDEVLQGLRVTMSSRCKQGEITRSWVNMILLIFILLMIFAGIALLLYSRP